MNDAVQREVAESAWNGAIGRESTGSHDCVGERKRVKKKEV